MRRALFGILLGCAASLVLLAALEIALRSTKQEPFWLVARARYPESYFVRHPLDPTRAAPGAWRVTLHHPETNELLYDVTYTVDEFGKRVTPVANREARDKFILFFGCSYTYGEGVADDETLPYWVGTLAHEYMPYNYGFHGASPYDALNRLERLDFSREVPEREGVGLYLYIRDHSDRLNDAPATASWHYGEAYYERMPDGRFVRNGSYESARPWRTRVYQFMWSSALIRATGLARPFEDEGDRLDLTADALAEVARRFAARFPGAPFYVVNYPGPGKWKLADRLASRGVQFLDYSKLFDIDAPGFRIPFDEHPTPLTHRTIAERLVLDLELGPSAASTASAAR